MKILCVLDADREDLTDQDALDITKSLHNFGLRATALTTETMELDVIITRDADEGTTAHLLHKWGYDVI